MVKGTKKLIEEISKLEPVEFLGVCKILGVEIYKDFDRSELEGKTLEELKTFMENVEARDGDELIQEVVDKVGRLNRIQRRNLNRLIKPIIKGEK